MSGETQIQQRLTTISRDISYLRGRNYSILSFLKVLARELLPSKYTINHSQIGFEGLPQSLAIKTSGLCRL